ncbi:MAG: exo-alpha-sialidase [Chitinophagaceae bacterium]
MVILVALNYTSNKASSSMRNTIIILSFIFLQLHVSAQNNNAVVTNEFIYQQAPFPSCHASTIAETPAGVMAAWFGGTDEGNNDVCIWGSRFVNQKWTVPFKIADGVINETTRYACYNPVLYQVPGGDLLLFYKIGPNVVGWTGWMMRSKDNGKTWSKREALPTGILGPIKNKPVLIKGVLLCPSSTENNGWQAHFEYTNDWGKTWTKSTDLNDGSTISAIQPTILQYKNNQLQALYRSRNKTINETWSSDGGKTWSAMQATGLPNNNSGIDAVTLKDGRQLLVYNHVKQELLSNEGRGPRSPLNVALSANGKTWKAAVVLEDEPGEYSYPSVIQTADSLVHIVYTWKRQLIKHVVINPSKLTGTTIVNGLWPAAVVKK